MDGFHHSHLCNGMGITKIMLVFFSTNLINSGWVNRNSIGGSTYCNCKLIPDLILIIGCKTNSN